MAKYNFILKHNDNDFKIFKTGKLLDVDSFIYDNKIKSAEELYEVLNDLFCYEMVGKISFEITSDQPHIKDRPVLFYNELKLVMQSTDEIKSQIFIRINNDPIMKQEFIEKFIFPILNANKKLSEKALYFLKHTDSLSAFNDIYNSIIYIKNKNTKLKKSTTEYSEMHDIEETLTPSYSSERKMIEFLLTYYNKIPNNTIYKRKSIDEFEELSIHDQNSDEDRISGIVKESYDTPSVKTKTIKYIQPSLLSIV